MFNTKKGKKSKSTENAEFKIITLTNPKSFISEQYRTIRTNIQYASQNKKLKTMVVTSASSGEGKTTTSANLGAVFALSGAKVLLVDADLRTCSLTKLFNGNRFSGLSTVLSGEDMNLEEFIRPVGLDNLFLLSSGSIPNNPSELIASPRMDTLLEEMENTYDIIIFDMPPVIPVTDAQIMSTKVDGSILVVREGYSNKRLIVKAKQLLDAVDTNLLGVIYNGAKTQDQQHYYYYGGDR